MSDVIYFAIGFASGIAATTLLLVYVVVME